MLEADRASIFMRMISLSVKNDHSREWCTDRGWLSLTPTGDQEWVELRWDSGVVKLSRGLEIYNFDHSGRPVSVTRKNDLFRRGLDGKLVRIWRYLEEGEKFHGCVPLDETESEQFLRSVSETLTTLRPRLGEEFRWLEPALKIDLKADAEVFRELYQEVGILPPDCYRTLLLNLTIGCSYNKCTFCNFFKEKTYSLRSPDQFRDHIDEVKRSFGPSISYRRGIFLGQANAANAPVASLESALTAIAEAFPCPYRDQEGNPRHPLGFERVSSFMDTFSRNQRPAEDWKKLYDLGLKSLYLGVESGSPRILKLLQKPGHPRYIKDLVTTLKEIGMEVNVIFMTGVGGKEMAKEHVDATIELLDSLPLTAGDRIYLSAFVPHPESEYYQIAQDRGLTPMSALECRWQTQEIRDRLRVPAYPQGPARTHYDINQFVY